WCFITSVLLSVTGLFLLVMRRSPGFFNRKLVGFYFSLLGMMLLRHFLPFERLLMETDNPSIIKATWDNLLVYVNGHGTSAQTGGGMLGGVLFAFCYYLFFSIGAKIVAVFSVIIGFSFMTEFSLGEFFAKIGKSIALMGKKFKSRLIEFRDNRQAAPGEELDKLLEDDQDLQNNSDESAIPVI